jgi:tetratricopeptide (TPR) repeat protein
VAGRSNGTSLWALLAAFGSILLTLALAPPATAAVKASRGEITLPTYPWAAVKHPYFRGTDKVNIYPYPMLDFLSRDRTNRIYRTVILENEYLRITFLPELGGKIHEVIDKTTGQPMFYVNHVIKPGLIGQCGAWTSGGVEWNTGPQGHTVSCMMPVAVEILPLEKDGSRSVAIGETERIYGTKWTVVVTLRPGRSFIEERIRIYNPTEYVRPYYFWNCTAVPNPPGFRFIYPMTLGMDHSGEKFFHWPINEGKDLTRGTNYQDASSIFAYHCDQDFFGSYDDGADRGVVSYANHYQVPGKKAWTWGQGGFGKMHQMDLTDTDGPYNEVQTGPLLTQGEVGRLDPCEAVEWKEWWYPVHGIGGFTFANRDVAVNSSIEGGNLHLRMIGSGSWSDIALQIPDGKSSRLATNCALSPTKITDLMVPLPNAGSAGATLLASGTVLARFSVPLYLPVVKPPGQKPKPETCSELAASGWRDLLFARDSEAEAQFRKALGKDTKSPQALTGLALLQIDRDPAGAEREAGAALATDPDCGLAHFAYAVATSREGNLGNSLDEAWKASLSPATAVAARALLGKLLLSACRQPEKAIAVLSESGPWETDVVCRGRRAYALLIMGATNRAADLAQSNLLTDPLDLFSRSILWLAKAESETPPLEEVIGGKADLVLDLAGQFAELHDYRTALDLLVHFYFDRVPTESREPLPGYWAGVYSLRGPGSRATYETYEAAQRLPARNVFPYRLESIEILQEAVDWHREDGKAALYLGHALFHFGRHAEGRKMWKKAAALGAEPVIAYRALGMAAKTLDGDLNTAREWLEKANQADPKDSIVARDLARVVLDLADKAETNKPAHFSQARNVLKGAFNEGRGRSDFVSLLARAQNRLGEYADTAQMLDQVRVTVWEGSHEVHDLFEEAHLALGEAHLKTGRPAEALTEFDRALEYPDNLATGKMENEREAHIHYLRGNALAVLGRKTEALAAWKKAADEPASKDPKKEEARKKARAALETGGR